MSIKIMDVDPPQGNPTFYKDEISKLAEEIQFDEGVNDIDGLKRATQALKNVRMKSTNFATDEPVPIEFKCHLSEKLIQDPVVVDTGCTYDRTSIQHYLSSGNKICPVSKKVISDTSLIIPNLILKRLISNWCKNNGVDYPTPLPDSEFRIDLLIAKLPNCTLPEKQSVVKELIALTERKENQALFDNRKEPIVVALFILLPTESQNLGLLNPEYHIDLARLTLNLSEIPNIRKAMGESSKVIPFTVESLRNGTPVEASIKACKILENLSELESNMKHLIKSETSKALLRILRGSDDPDMVNAAVSTLVKLCKHNSFLQRATSEGMHRLALLKMKNNPFYEGAMLDILTLFLDNYDIVYELMELNAAPSLVSIIRKLEGTEEPAVALLYDMFELNEGLIELIRDDIEIKECLTAIANSGSESAIPKAVEIIAKLKPRAYPMRRYNMEVDRRYGSSSKSVFR